MLLLLSKLAIGAGLGIVISTTGVGGGILVIPVLSYVFAMDALAAVATANLLSMLMKMSSTVIHIRLGNIPIRHALLILAIMLPSTFIASSGVTYLSNIKHWLPYVEITINVLVVIAISISMFIFYHHLSVNKKKTNQPMSNSASRQENIRSLIIPASGAGIILGTTGVGGGIIVLPLLFKYSKMSIKQAIGTSVFVTMLLSGASALAYAQGGHTDLSLALILGIGSMFSIPLAKYALTTIPDYQLERITLALIFCSATSMIYNLVIKW